MKPGNCLAISLAAWGAIVPCNALAQDTQAQTTTPTNRDDRDDQNIVVTALRREQTVQDVPAPVTAFGEQFINDMRLTNAREFTQLVPNAVFEEGSFNINQSVSIRGVRPGQDISEPGFGSYRDGQYMGGLRTNFSDFMDLERVEVLRGPQGALYGRNAVGGAINFVYNRPDLQTLSGRGEVSYSSHDRFEGRVTANIPIQEGELAARFNAWFVDQNRGQFYNSTIGEYVDTYRSTGARAQLLWRPGNDLTVRLTAERNSQQTPEIVGVQPGLGETDRTIVADTSSRADKDWTFLASDIRYNTSAGEFSLLTSYRPYRLRSSADQDGGANPLLQQTIRRFEDSRAYYATLQWISPADWPVTFVAGADYFNENFDLTRPVTCVGSSCTSSKAQSIFTIPTRSIAFFAEATWHITDSLSLIGSARYTHDGKRLDFLRQVFNTAGVQTTNIPVQDSATFNNTSFGGGLQWRPNSHVNLYARVNQGFRAGGYNTGISQANFEIDRLPFDEETSTNYEIGAKTNWLGNRLILNVAAFRLYQRNLQGFVPDKFFNFFVDNVGRARTDGIEVEASVRPVRNLLLTAGFGWIDGKLTGGADYSGQLAGQSIQFGNGVNWNINGVYRIPLDSTKSFVIQGSWRRFNPSFRNVPLFFVGDINNFQDVDNVDASLALEGRHWQVRAYVSNLFDNRYIVSEALFAPVPNGTLFGYNADRRFGIEFTVDY